MSLKKASWANITRQALSEVVIAAVVCNMFHLRRSFSLNVQLQIVKLRINWIIFIDSKLEVQLKVQLEVQNLTWARIQTR